MKRSTIQPTDGLAYKRLFIDVVLFPFAREIALKSFIHSVLRPLLGVANVPCKPALFIWSYRFEPVQSLRSSTHVRLDPSLPRLPSISEKLISGKTEAVIPLPHNEKAGWNGQ